jgi:hypothetical protein
MDKILSFSNVTLSNLVLLLLLCCGVCLSLTYIVIQNNKNLIDQIKEDDEIKKYLDKVDKQLIEIEAKIQVLTSFLPMKFSKVYKKDSLLEDLDES